MLWPVLLDSSPRATSWSLGERVSTRLRWLDHPDLPDDLVLRGVTTRADTLTNVHGAPWAQLVGSGDLRAVREGDLRAGDVTLDGCLGFDALLGVIGELPDTVGVVRRVRVLHELHDRGTHGWIRRTGGPRLTDVPDGSPERLCDDFLVDPTPADVKPGAMDFLSPEQYFELARDRLPAEQWQARGFLVDLDVADSA